MQIRNICEVNAIIQDKMINKYLTTIIPNDIINIRLDETKQDYIRKEIYMTATDILKLYIKIGKPFQVKLYGNSMQPVLWDGDLILVQPQTNLKRGDIVLFIYHGEGVLAHRVIRRAKYNFLCKGDNSFRIEKVSSECIIGKVIGRYAEKGWHNRCFRFRIISMFVCYLSNKVNQQSIELHWIIPYVQKKFPYRFLQWLLKHDSLYSKKEIP